MQFDEIIIFKNNFEQFKKMEFNNPISDCVQYYILSNIDFSLYFEDKSSKMDINRVKIEEIINFIEEFSISNNDNWKKFFLNKINFYAKTIGFLLTCNFLIPSLKKK